MLTVHFESEEECIGEKTPPSRQAQERLGEKTNEPRGGNSTASDLDLEAEGEYSNDPKGEKNNEGVMHSSPSVKLQMEQNACSSLKEAFLKVKSQKGNYLFIDELLYHTDKALGQPVTQLRWTLALQKYNLHIEHCPGSKLINADALSRLPIEDS
ncbi:hypothetical protein TNCT_460071 [Trichonephila clavata]|uniref:Uncharacterized protein n=1 Tax=Trichonephila clavata TaxID=2740835 RepID=A0A8X6EZD3_TRICU|nr:hypothetical protein TNCT_460071 [Trichonephila clavata]